MAHNHNKIILLLMVKNESKIIQRCIESAIIHIDAIVILDTGSTDNTVDISYNYLISTGKPFKIHTDPFINFGKSRTISFLKAQEFCDELQWDPTNTYAMAVDADMLIVPSERFKDTKLIQNGYTVIQKGGSTSYYNVRFMKCSYPWKCIGATHEYWSGDPTAKLTTDIFYIDDRNDGGCKSDKFERDVRLLTQEIAENPLNDRAHYYLGQSLKDSGQFHNAIKMFEKRITLGGWYEEVFYSMYMIGKCYDHLGDLSQMELWMNKAFQYHSRRSEPLYHLTKRYRELSEHYKSYHYYLKGRHIPYPKDDVLFIEDNVYNGLFEYESTILLCYVDSQCKHTGLSSIVSYINRYHHFMENTWDNMYHYIQPLTDNVYGGSYKSFEWAIPYTDYKASSCSIIPYSDVNPDVNPDVRFLVNVRYVNYTIGERGEYIMNGDTSCVKTVNVMVYLDESFKVIGQMKLMEDSYNTFSSNICGMEDIRLFYSTIHNKLCFSASSKNLTDDGRIVIAIGEYDTSEYKLYRPVVIETLRKEYCEKNWTFIPKCEYTLQYPNVEHFIYKWHPLEIGSILDNTLVIHTTHSTPTVFERIRGSSPIIQYEGKLWCVVHIVRYSTPRVYYHSVVQLNSITCLPERYTLPFCFRKKQIEYCIGFLIESRTIYGPEFIFVFSENDSTPGMITVPMNRLQFVNV
jgi:glycosyltransferase involved in cell wall biosynthesis